MKTAADAIMLSGAGTVFLDHEGIGYQPETRLLFPAGSSHGFYSQGRTIFLSIQGGAILDPVTKERDFFEDAAFIRPDWTYPTVEQRLQQG